MDSKEKIRKLTMYLTGLLKKEGGNLLDAGEESIVRTQMEPGLVDYTFLKKITGLSPENDRTVPIDATTLNEFNTKTEGNLERAEVHYGPSSDELARSYHANAVTIGSAIYFRSRSYKPETEEGSKTLVHELTHVQQNKNKLDSHRKTVDELEKEAVLSEKVAANNPQRFREIECMGKKYRLTEKQYRCLMNEIQERVETSVENNIMNLSEEEYYRFLLAYERREENGDFIWQK